MKEFEAIPDGFLSLEDFIGKHFADSDRKALSDIRQRKANELLDRIGAETPAYLRMMAGLSQTKLAKLVGTSQPSIARLEAGLERPSYEKITKLRAALDVTYDRLMEAIGNVPNEG